eukprot:Skav206276  [mRNA]  locus=scaffold888:503653:503844:- [translate_table: standard]
MEAKGYGLLEHPEDPNEGEVTEKVTIWRLPLVAALLRHDHIKLHRVLQGYYVAPRHRSRLGYW